MTAKATHQGHCQVCDRLQMLPKGKLAKHGYNVRWGFFSGTCWGAGHLPYEQDASLIAKSIEIAERRLIELRQERDALRQPATQPRAWYHQYQGLNALTPYKWVEVDLVEGQRYGNPATVMMLDGKQQGGAYTWEVSMKTPLDAATFLNDKKANWIVRELIAEVERYLQHQRARLAAWKPNQPLVPVVEKPEAEKVHKCPRCARRRPAGFRCRTCNRLMCPHYAKDTDYSTATCVCIECAGQGASRVVVR